MRPPAPVVRSFVAVVCAALGAISCSRESVLTSVSIQAPLTSDAGDVVLALVEAVQDDDRQRIEVRGSEESAVLTLRAGEQATITGTVFIFADRAWYAHTSTQVMTPNVGTTQLSLALDKAPEIVGSLVPGAIVRGVAQQIDDEPLPITLTDLATQWTVTTPFTTNQQLTFPSGRAILVQIDDRFGGGTATRTFDTIVFAPGTPIPVTADATIPIVNDDFNGLIDAIAPLQNSSLGLECAVGGSCASGTFGACDTTTLSLATESAYTVAIRYAKVPASCIEARVVRDLTPPSYMTTFDPPLIQAGATRVRLVLDASEPVIAEQTVVNTATDATNRCTPTAISPTRVSCDINLQGLTLASFLDLNVSMVDRSRLIGQRAVRLRVRTSAPIQVVGYETYPGTFTTPDPDGVLGITFAIYDKQNLCGFSPEDSDIALTRPGESTSAGWSAWLGDSNAIADPTADATLVTLYARVYPYGATAGTYTMTFGFTFDACQGRAALTVPFEDTLTIGVAQPAWVGAPYTLSSGFGSSNDLPLVNTSSYDIESSNDAVLDIEMGEGISLWAPRTGTARVTTVPYSEQGVPPQQSVSADYEVSSQTEIIALQEQRIVRRSAASDAVLDLPQAIGFGRRVLWESTRNMTVGVGDVGVALLRNDGSVAMIEAPCGAVEILDATLTAAGVAHGNAPADLALLVLDSQNAAIHCEIDLTLGSVVASAPIVTPGCDDLSRIANDAMSNVFVVAGDGCVATYERTGLDVLVTRDTTTYVGSNAEQLVVSSRYALAVVLTRNSYVFSFDLTVGLAASQFNLQPYSGALFYPNAIAIHPITGTVWVGGRSDRQGSPIGMYMGFGDRHGGYHDSEQVRADLTSRFTPSVMRFDGSTNAFYVTGSDDNDPLLTIDAADLMARSNWVETARYPVRTWPNSISVSDIAIVGPQPYGIDVATVVAGQRATIYGSGFAGGGRDEVFVYGMRAQVVASSTTAITFVVPQAISRLNAWRVDDVYASVQVRSNGLMSGRVPLMAARGSGSDSDLVVQVPHRRYQATNMGTSALAPEGAGRTYVLDSGGSYGQYGMYVSQPQNTEYGISRIDHESLNYSAYYFSQNGLATPVVLPATQRLIGVFGSALVDQLIAGFEYFNDSIEAVTPKRTRAYTGSPISNLAAGADGSILAAATPSSIDFYWASTLAKHPTASVATSIHDFMSFSPSGMLVTASRTGELAAFRVENGTSAPITLARNATTCPSGNRTSVLALATNVWTAEAGAEAALAITTYAGNVIAAEEIVTNANGTTVQCRSYGYFPGAPQLAAIDSAGLKAAVYSSGQLRILDTRTVSQARSVNGSLANAPQGMLFSRFADAVVVYDSQNFVTHRMGMD